MVAPAGRTGPQHTPDFITHLGNPVLPELTPGVTARSRVRLEEGTGEALRGHGSLRPVPAAESFADDAAQHRLDRGFLGRGELAPEAGALGPGVAVVARLERHPPGADPPPQRPDRVLQTPP